MRIGRRICQINIIILSQFLWQMQYVIFRCYVIPSPVKLLACIVVLLLRGTCIDVNIQGKVKSISDCRMVVISYVLLDT